MEFTKFRDLENKVVLVTGANGGMGLAITQAFVAQGASVIASDIQAQVHENLRAEKQVSYLQADVTSEPQVESLLHEVAQDHGRLDCAVNTAAVEFELARLADCDTDDFDRMMAVNLRGLFLCMKHEIRAMLAGGQSGAIVNIASTTSVQAGQLQPAYSTSKHGVLGMTRQAALDYVGDGIRINAVAPGNIDTPMLQGALERRGIEKNRVESMMPMKRFGRPEEIAEATLWLCSEASSFTTGHLLAVEGGMLLT